jgi:hypothetical protein
MASASVGTSPNPLSPYELEFPPAAESAGDADDAFWTAISNPSAGTGSVGGFISSPASHSLGSSWAVLANGGQLSPALSPPVNQDLDQLSPFSRASFPGEQSAQGTFGNSSAAGQVSLFTQGFVQDGQDLFAPGNLGFGFDNQFNGKGCWVLASFLGGVLIFPAEFSTLFNGLDSFQPVDGQQPLNIFDFENPQPLQSGVDVPPWEPFNLRGNDVSTAPILGEPSPIFIIEDPTFTSPSPSQQYSPSALSVSVSPPASASPVSPTQFKADPVSPTQFKVESIPDYSKSPTTTTAKAPASAPIPIRKVNNTNRIQKRKTTTTSPSNPSPVSTSLNSLSTSGGTSKFLIVTPSSINLHSDKPNPFECFEALSNPSATTTTGASNSAASRASQRGRKGPLATDTKQSALQVRRKGACFSCHARKVRCDHQRPCRSCVRLMAQIPQAVCWQFCDFTTVLFPEFIRGHLRKEEVVKFVGENIESFTVRGVEVPCTVQLVSGVGFRAVLEVRAKFFTAKTPDVLQHWHVQMGRNSMGLHSRGAAPIGLEVEGHGVGGGDAQRSEMRRRVKEYIQAIVDEPRFAELVTPAPQHTELPRKVLRIVHDYAQRCDVPIVRRALSIYAMHFVMTRHLCLTQQNIAQLEPTGLVSQGVPWVTSRVLNRQIKAVIDDMLCREMQLLFENFSKSLKPKQRREWAPCLASFLILCLFMESVEMAADMFVISDNEINLRHHYSPAWKRSFVLDVNSQIENMPFKQFAFQFHQIYQTHSRDAAARSFNPLMDDACFEQDELDHDATDMVQQLRRFVNEDCESVLSEPPEGEMLTFMAGAELDYLTADPILPNTEDHPYPRNVSYNYTGRLVAKFLLSFTDEKYIFDSKT